MGKVKDRLQRVLDECYAIYEKGGQGEVFYHVTRQRDDRNPDYEGVTYERCNACECDSPSLSHTCLVCGQETQPNYFEIVHQGFQPASQREEIQIHAGENGNIYIYRSEDKLGFIVDVYGQNDLVDSMAIWEESMEELYDDDDEISFDDYAPENFSMAEIEDFKDQWGQYHDEICAELGYDEKDSDELLMVDYFWIEEDKKWYPKCASAYSEREQAIADYLRKTNNEQIVIATALN